MREAESLLRSLCYTSEFSYTRVDECVPLCVCVKKSERQRHRREVFGQNFPSFLFRRSSSIVSTLESQTTRLNSEEVGEEEDDDEEERNFLLCSACFKFSARIRYT